MSNNEKKRHHYVPVAYLSAFTDERGRVFAYRKDDPQKPLYVRPSEIAFQRYYYSQPMSDGGQDNNRIEDFFSTVESNWPGILAKCQAREYLTVQDVTHVFEFLGMMRVRVPAARDAVEAILASSVKIVGKMMEDAGELPPPPPDLADYLKLENLEVAIDPHRSIHAMATLAKGFAAVANVIGLEVLHLPDGETLITSDNPVIYFDPDIPEHSLLPYTVRPPRGAVELLFPISPSMVVRGHTGTKYRFGRDGVLHRDITSREYIKRINRLVARFGYQLLIAQSSDHSPLVLKYADLSPVIETRVLDGNGGKLMISQSVFGTRRSKPRWVRRSEPSVDG
jgi:hypothetical protein